MTPPSDEVLIAQVASGDSTAFEQLVRRYQAPALNLAYRFLGDAAEAEEVVQETFLGVYRNAGRFRPVAPFQGWLFRILSNLCRDALKKSKPVYWSVVPDRISPEPNAADQLERTDRQEAVMRAVARLPANQRLALLLSMVEDLSYRDIAESLNLSVSAVESLLVRAKAKLRLDLRAYF